MENDQSDLEKILSSRRGNASDQPASDEEMLDFLIFEIADEWYAFRGASIREILPLMPVFFVPACPPWLEGVINVRGDIESVVNLSALLGTSRSGTARSGSILIGNGAGIQSGIRIDRVLDVVAQPKSAVREAPAALSPALTRITVGLLVYRDVPVMILDLDRIFEDCGRILGSV